MGREGGDFSSWLFADSENEVGTLSTEEKPLGRGRCQEKSRVTLQAKHTSPRVSGLVLCVEFFPFLILEASVSSNQKHFSVVLCGSADAIVGRALFAV